MPTWTTTVPKAPCSFMLYTDHKEVSDPALLNRGLLSTLRYWDSGTIKIYGLILAFVSGCVKLQQPFLLSPFQRASSQHGLLGLNAALSIPSFKPNLKI